MQGRSAFKLFLTAAVATTAALLLPVASAGANLLATTTDCPDRPTSQPFSAWGDLNDYVLAPDGGVENGAGEWVLGSGSSIVAGNEPFYLRAAGDSHSIQVNNGSTATTATMCIGQEHPTMRFMARNIGSSSSKLWVQAAVETARGRELSLPIGIERGNAAWEPSTAMRLWVNYLNLEPGTYTPIEFSFTAQGGSWLVDDVFVDPRKH